MHDAIARVSETLFRVANSADLTGLSLEVDLFGKELAHEGEEREKGDEKNGEVKAKAPPIAIEPRRKRYQSPLNHHEFTTGLLTAWRMSSGGTLSHFFANVST